jgi:hypothetical protein
MITYKQLAEAILLENNNFRGEYWIQDGYVQFADGDVGDLNHEAIVIQSAASQVLSHIGIDADEPYIPDMDDEIYEAIQNDLPEEIQTQYVDGEISAKDCLKYYGKHVLQNAKFDELVDAAYDRIDVRRFAMREWGWKAIRGNNVDTWNLTSEDLKKISSGLSDAYDAEITQYEQNNKSVDENGFAGPYFNIEVYSVGDYYSDVPFSLIESKNVASLRPYKTINRGERITESNGLVGRVELPSKKNKIDDSLRQELNDLSKKYEENLDSRAYGYVDHIKLDALVAKKTAPVGTGSAYMNELCRIADKYQRIIVLYTATRGYGGGNGFKKTTSTDRIKRFYQRFGFVSNYSNPDYNPDLGGNMHRNPK